MDFNIVLEYYNLHNRLVDYNLVYNLFYITDQLQGCAVFIDSVLRAVVLYLISGV